MYVSNILNPEIIMIDNNIVYFLNIKISDVTANIISGVTLIMISTISIG